MSFFRFTLSNRKGKLSAATRQVQEAEKQEKELGETSRVAFCGGELKHLHVHLHLPSDWTTSAALDSKKLFCMLVARIEVWSFFIHSHAVVFPAHSNDSVAEVAHLSAACAAVNTAQKCFIHPRFAAHHPILRLTWRFFPSSSLRFSNFPRYARFVRSFSPFPMFIHCLFARSLLFLFFRRFFFDSRVHDDLSSSSATWRLYWHWHCVNKGDVRATISTFPFVFLHFQGGASETGTGMRI